MRSVHARAPLALVIIGTLPQLAAAQWTPPYWELSRAGLTDAQHTHPSGLQNSSAAAMNSAGMLIGSSVRYRVNNTNGQSAWAWSPELGTRLIGLIDDEHTAGNEGNGMTDLESLVAGGLSGEGWSLLSTVVDGLEYSTIAGHGTLIGRAGQAVYVLTIPAPAGGGLLVLGGAWCGRRRRR